LSKSADDRPRDLIGRAIVHRRVRLYRARIRDRCGSSQAGPAGTWDH